MKTNTKAGACIPQTGCPHLPKRGTSGRIGQQKYWPDWTPVAGQQFEYSHDDIGNRRSTRTGGDQNGAGLRYAGYNANSLNQYTTRDFPGSADIIGVAIATNSVTVNGQAAYRKGEYFWKQFDTNNTNAPVYAQVTVSSAASNIVGNVFLPKTQEAFDYDADGNLTSDGRWNYFWDAENRLIALAARTSVGPQISLRFEYDFNARRIRKQVWSNTAWAGNSTNDLRFVYDGWNLLATLNPAFSTLNSFTWGLDLSGSEQGAGGIGGLLAIWDSSALNSQPSTHFCAFDANGNVSGLANAATMATMAEYGHGPFAEVIRATGSMAKASPVRFSTRYQDDETDLLYYGYRYYAGSTGVWINRDPVGHQGGLNPYGFVSSDPVNSIDRLGLKRCGISWFSATYSLRTDPPPYGISWRIDVDVTFRKDGDYDPRCCDIKQTVLGVYNKPPGKPGLNVPDDGYNRDSNDSDPGYNQHKFDYSLQKFHYEDNPQSAATRGQEYDGIWAFTQIVFGPGVAKGQGPCPCERQGEIARITHEVHFTGIFPNINFNDTVPARVFMATLR